MTENKATIVSRRKLLAGLAVGGVAAGAIAAPKLTLSWVQEGRSVASSWWDRTFFSLSRGGFSQWSRAVGTSFTLSGAGGAAELALVAVKPFAASGRRPAGLGRDRAFLAVFETKRGSLPAGDLTSAFQHPQYGTLDIFMTSGQPSGTSSRLEAVFN
jgi:hypothetical protein